jgi:predicted nicotinamide N-methyase
MDILVSQLLQRVQIYSLPLHLLSPTPTEEETIQIFQTLQKIALTNQHYSGEVLKKILPKLELTEDGAPDELYDALGEWIHARPLQPTELDTVIYTFQHGLRVAIQESPNVISGLGTTGLRTWEASLYLSECLLNRSEEFPLNDGDVLELGCGTGLVGLSLLKNGLTDKHRIIMSDGDSQVVERVAQNLKINDLSSQDDSKLDVRRLWWGEDDVPATATTIIAADVTYDASVIPDLVQVLNEAMSEGNVKTAYIAATLRNDETLAEFDRWLDMGASDEVWTWEVISRRDEGQNDAHSTLFYGAHPIPVLVYRLCAV